MEIKIRQCQNTEKTKDCWSREFMETVQESCECVPFQLRKIENFTINLQSIGSKQQCQAQFRQNY